MTDPLTVHFNDDPDPAVRFTRWRDICRAHISVDLCDRLDRNGFPEAAAALLRLIGDDL